MACHHARPLPFPTATGHFVNSEMRKCRSKTAQAAGILARLLLLLPNFVGTADFGSACGLLPSCLVGGFCPSTLSSGSGGMVSKAAHKETQQTQQGQAHRERHQPRTRTHTSTHTEAPLRAGFLEAAFSCAFRLRFSSCLCLSPSFPPLNLRGGSAVSAESDERSIFDELPLLLRFFSGCICLLLSWRSPH